MIIIAVASAIPPSRHPAIRQPGVLGRHAFRSSAV
jgi:hypothetical protein